MQIWDVSKACALVNYRGHTSRVLCVSWDVCDPDLVYSGGEDSCLHAWRLSAQTHTAPPTGSINDLMFDNALIGFIL
jgi:WD40 repeat protein